ncbi:MAG TPA: hypothetical protein VLD59_04535, partial [Steroidobacteraceae bacterium]|nr:hypothetical protein [Steroidobacteraceae bacterium]
VIPIISMSPSYLVRRSTRMLEDFFNLFLEFLWPQPPPTGPVIGGCLAGGTLGGNALSDVTS